MKKAVALLSLAVLIFFLAVAIFADFLAPYDPNAVDMANGLAAPSAQHWLGTDHLGRDLLSRLIYGSRSSVFIAFFATGCTLLVGMTIGLVSGYLGGWVDQLIQALVNIFQGIPSTAFVVAVLGLLGPGIRSLLIAIVVSAWAGFSRVVRNQVLEIREMHYIEGARAMGGGSFYIMRRHVLPNILLPLLVLITDGRANFSRGGDPVEEALRAARRVAEAHIPAVVIDTERQFVSLGLAAQVAQVMGAPCYRVEELRARPLAQLVRGHSPAAG